MSNIVNTEVTMSSLELLEIVNATRAEFGESSIRNNDFLKRVKAELEGDAYESFVTAPEGGGTPMEVLQLTHDQCMLVAMRESKGVRRKVLQKLKNTEQAQLKPPVSLPPALADQLLLVETAARMLNVSESGKLHMLGIAAQRHGIDPTGLLPAYTVDAPAGGVSAEVTKSLTELTKEFGVEQSVKILNLQTEPVPAVSKKGFGRLLKLACTTARTWSAPQTPKKPSLTGMSAASMT
ncbi:hypothetical protein LX59_03015 [Azomonas agilis]|uniref:Uncharacterized protein n=1 Tax=Azomonas agilis TaxID=116849 RepID=A0A562HYM9_9GAMM|nr:hypothetical protein [Azomonas agilis]TWH63851.1 hypothetical protein LX59_03015 [Azomonas agilis]